MVGRISYGRPGRREDALVTFKPIRGTYCATAAQKKNSRAKRANFGPRPLSSLLTPLTPSQVLIVA